MAFLVVIGLGYAPGVMMRRALIALLLAAPLTAQAQVRDEPTGPDCSSVPACVEIIRTFEIEPTPPAGVHLSSGINPRPIGRAINRLRDFGDEGVVALLPLLNNENYNVQNRAAYALFHFQSIDPRHEGQLIAAHRRGLGWLVQPIARTGADTAVDYLWSDFLADPHFGSNSQMAWALPRFGDRLFPRLTEALEQCRVAAEHEPCSRIIQLLAQYDPYPAFALPHLVDIATSTASSESARDVALDHLIRQRHPYGLIAIRESLEATVVNLPPLPPLPAGPSLTTVSNGGLDDLGIAITIDQAAGYGADGAALGPVIARFLDRRDLPEARQAAALALGQIGHSEGVDALLAHASGYSDDWYFAYNAAESLGRLRAERSRALLQRIARSHWFQPVRNNAARALNVLDGGGFERPGVANDAAEPENEFAGLGSAFRYQGDSDPPLSCPAPDPAYDTVAYTQFSPRDLRWPRRGRSVELEPRRPSAAQGRAFLRDTPSFEPNGEITFLVSMPGAVIAGTNAGEWGGGVYEIADSGQARMLIPDNAVAAFKSGRRLFVIAGLSHLFMSRGDLWIIDVRGGRPRVQRRIQLPSEPYAFELTSPETLVIRTERGDLAIRSDGELLHPHEIEACSNLLEPRHH